MSQQQVAIQTALMGGAPLVGQRGLSGDFELVPGTVPGTPGLGRGSGSVREAGSSGPGGTGFGHCHLKTAEGVSGWLQK